MLKKNNIEIIILYINIKGFSRDVESLESSIPNSFYDLLMQFFNLVTIVITISLSTPIFLTTLLPILFVYVIIQVWYYMKFSNFNY